MFSWFSDTFWFLSARWVWVGSLGVVLACACNGPTSKSHVLDPLPGPYYVGYLPRPAFVSQRSVEPSPPAKEEPAPLPGHKWIPAKGLSDRWEYILIHHTASENGSMADVDQWHRKQGWENGCGYHFVIGNATRSANGQVEMGPRWREQATGAHCRLSPAYARQTGVQENYYNEHGIGIALVGDFNARRPTAEQMASLAELVAFLMERCKIPPSRVVRHRDVDQTDCPGLFFSMSELRGRIESLR